MSNISNERLKWMTNISSRDEIEDIGGDEIREMARDLLAYRKSSKEPVAWEWQNRQQRHVTNDEERARNLAWDGVKIIPLYAATQLHAFPDKVSTEGFDPKDWHDARQLGQCEGWNAYRATMLSNEPQNPQQNIPENIPNGWMMLPNSLSAENGAKACLSGEFVETKFISCPECLGDDDCESCDGSGLVKVEVPVSWTTIKAIWTKGVEHFTTAQPPADTDSTTAQYESLSK